ncbi:hypothetical protein KUTeg_013772 [Tegillarca granosa]|uniref:Lipocalin/cytosolic fatty-acid binding domain-containing protein n=1 Tax=Tegillarca granosa TaxID=220873 RepID=A0ABQ9EUM8_TEGGR|nr:hypothetical protein KUTeg_013772 [Tegillarca granosa]
MDYKHTVLCTLLLALWTVPSSALNCKFANFNVKPNFNLEKYLGKWYEMKWLAQNYIPEDQLFQDYAHNYVMESNGTITAYIKGRDPTTPDKCFRYSAWITQTNTPGKLRYRRWASSDRSAQITSDYWVLMTDYINYAFVYGCRVPFENGTCNEPDSWIWSRTQSLPESTMNLITKKMEEVCVDPTKYLATRQNNGFKRESSTNLIEKSSLVYFKKLHESDRTTRKCPECRYKLTEVVKSFDVQKYTGNWYQLRIYKPNAKIGFTPKNTIHSLTVRDNTGLDFTITNRDNNEGLKLDYWVMGTDYVSYSVVYSCLVPGANSTCSQAEVIVFGRKKSLSASDWEMVKKKVINVCLDPMDYIDINDSRDCSTSGSRQIGHQNEVTCLIAFLFIIIWKISSDISSA